MPVILEGIVTTLDPAGGMNVAPMGPIIGREDYEAGTICRLLLRPFTSSTTYRNLKAHGEGVFHVTDDVWLLARAAIGKLEEPPDTFASEKVRGCVLADCCRWYEFRVERLDDSQERTRIEAVVVSCGRRRDFFGFNRAKHAVLEAAILATRVHLLPREQIAAELARLRPLVGKTGGEAEQRAFELLARYVGEVVQ